MNKRFLLTLAAVVLLLGGIFWFTKNKAGAPEPTTGNVQASNHTDGKGAEGVTLVEYGDFECPACGGYYPILKQLKQDYGDKFTFQFRHFPLTQIHPNAMAAHRAAEAAGKQGKFWEMHDLLYENQQTWRGQRSNPALIFESFAQQIGLNMDQYKQDVASPETNAVINADIKKGQELDVSSTPTFFLNDKKITDAPRNLEGFKKLIDDTVAASKGGQ